MLIADMIATIEELQAQLADAKRLLLTLCESRELGSPELRELASSAVMAEVMMDDLSRSIRLRQRARPMRLAPHEIQVIETAFMVDRSIGLALRRVVEASAGSFAVH